MFLASTLFLKKVDTNVTISNARVTYGQPAQFAMFNKGSDLHLPIEKGVILASNPVRYILQHSTIELRGDLAKTYRDLDLQKVNQASIYDPAILEFDISSYTNSITIEYLFASDEYPEYVCSEYNDTFVFVVSGSDLDAPINIATLPDSTTPININAINGGYVGASGGNSVPCVLSNTAYYTDNANNAYNFAYDGATSLLSTSLTVTPRETYHLKLAIADSSDGILDSAVFIHSISGGVSSDFGDAPASYEGTDPASHFLTTDLMLGGLVSPDGAHKPHSFALADEDDGVTFVDEVFAGNHTLVKVHASQAGVLNAWMDFQQDGFFQSSDHVIQDAHVDAGLNELCIAIPNNIQAGTLFSRFRLTQDSGVSPIGQIDNGEVEDYAVEIYSVDKKDAFVLKDHTTCSTL